MIRHRRLDHRFVEDIPETLDPGVLYVSMRYATAVHLCCCGCECEVVTPFSPAQWKMTFDGESLSLHPSIGSWALPCRSHYVIRSGRVIEAPQWSDNQVESGRLRDKSARLAHYVSKGRLGELGKERVPPKEGDASAGRSTRWSHWISNLIAIWKGKL